MGTMWTRVLRVCAVVALLVSQCPLGGCGLGADESAGLSNSQVDATATVAPVRILDVGETVTFSGLEITLKSVGAGPDDAAGKPMSNITVEYENRGAKPASFGFTDWTLVDAGGVEAALVADADLGFGLLPPGGRRSGTVYFSVAGEPGRVEYSPSRGKALAVWELRP